MKRAILTGVFLTFFIASDALAFCTWGIVPPGRTYEPQNATEAFLSYENGIQTLVLKPEWKGDTTDFAIVFPTPSKPEVIEGPLALFSQLEEATNPFLPRPMFLEDDATFDQAAGVSTPEKVVVIEEKKVGDYDVTVLTATDSKELVEWLEDNDYNYGKDDEDKMEYYVKEGGFYFIALKVSYDDFEPSISVEIMNDKEKDRVGVSSAPLSIAPRWFGELEPIQISFKTDSPQLPMRTLKSNMPEMTFDLYTLGTQALYVPGVDTVWSNIVDVDFLNKAPALSDYVPKGKWLLRQEVKFDPSQSDNDLFLKIATTNNFTPVNTGSQVRFDPSSLDKTTGIIPGIRGQVVYTDGSGQSYQFKRSLSAGSVGEDVLALQRLLNDEGFTVSEVGAGSPGNETSYFGARTVGALVRYQNFYRTEILTPVGLTTGTGYFGPSTISHINR